MKKKETILWVIGTVILTTCTFIIQQKEAMEFLKLPSYIFDGAGLLALLIRTVILKLKKEN